MSRTIPRDAQPCVTTRHLDEICLGARAAPITGFPGIHSVWIGASAVGLPREWVAFDDTGELAQAVVRDAWWQFWTKPFRAFGDRDGHHLVFWQAARLDTGGHNGSPTGAWLTREDALGNTRREALQVSLPALCRGIPGSRSRSLMEAGMRRCLRSQLRYRGLPQDIPLPLLDSLGFRVEAQLDARMDWAHAADELLQLAIGSERVAQVLAQMAPPRARGLHWQRHVFALRDVIDGWPVEADTWLPFAVPMHQQRMSASSPADVVRWLRGQGLSRQSVSRLQRLSPHLAARIAVHLLDLRPAAVPAVLAALNRFLAIVADVRAAPHGAAMTDVHVERALGWFAVDAAQALRAHPRPHLAHLTVCATARTDDELPWPVSGRVEAATLRGLRNVAVGNGPRARERWRAPVAGADEPEPRAVRDMRELRDREERRAAGAPPTLRFGEQAELHAGVGAASMTAAEIAFRREPGEGAVVQRFAAVLTRQWLQPGERVAVPGHVFTDTCDWFLRANPRPGLAQLRGDWQDIQRRQRAWHEEEPVPEEWHDIVPPPPATWPAWLPVQEVAPWRALPLASTAELAEEGAAMRHCVATYAWDCAEGRSAIFSIRLGDERYGTAQYVSHGDTWSLAQFRGLRNVELPKPGTVAVEELQALLAGIAVQLARVDWRRLRTGTGY